MTKNLSDREENLIFRKQILKNLQFSTHTLKIITYWL